MAASWLFQRDCAHVARGEAIKEIILRRNPARRLAINCGGARLGLGPAVTLTLATDTKTTDVIRDDQHIRSVDIACTATI